ncbi:uncharacterized protein LOC126856447 isoform X2 [Cataglyphis hispanica]|uniref:uncharacterized protein LOC126856447 isoform X2 n=1 Tax=Cataglyphis hispanica TaxID=1086592 RepID=UPI002180033F|nr:uncharacterized protein LOC126856447 isoform X2 [Cataglyphis hispanica]
MSAMNIDDMSGSEKSACMKCSHEPSSKKLKKSNRQYPTCSLCRNHNLLKEVGDHKRLCLGQFCICANCCERRKRQDETALQTKETRALKHDKELMKGEKLLPEEVLIDPSKSVKPFLIPKEFQHLIPRQILNRCSIISDKEVLVDSPKPAFSVSETNKHSTNTRQILNKCFSTFSEEVSKKQKKRKRKEEIMEVKRIKGDHLDKICQDQDDPSFYSKYSSEKKPETSTSNEDIIEPKKIRMEIIFVDKYKENIRYKAKANEEEIIEPEKAEANYNNLKDLLYYTLHNCCLVYDYVRANLISTLVKKIVDTIIECNRSSNSNEENSYYEAQKRLFPPPIIRHLKIIRRTIALNIISLFVIVNSTYYLFLFMYYLFPP